MLAFLTGVEAYAERAASLGSDAARREAEAWLAAGNAATGAAEPAEPGF